MRTKIIFPCLMLLATCGWLASLSGKKTPVVVVVPTVVHAHPETPAENPAPPPMVTANLSLTENFSTPVAPSPAERSEQLAALGMSGNAYALGEILTALTDADRDIRTAAREAAVQFGSQDAIPALQSALTAASDASEVTTLQSAIEFLELPALTETLAGR